MPAILLKDLPAGLHLKLKARAKASRRSMSSEAISIIEQAMHDRAGPPSLADIDARRIRGLRPLTQAVIDQARLEGRP